MVENKQLAAFIKVQEGKLQAKIYSRKYERLAAGFGSRRAGGKWSANERVYHYHGKIRPGGSPWGDRHDNAARDDILSTYELKFLR